MASGAIAIRVPQPLAACTWDFARAHEPAECLRPTDFLLLGRLRSW